MFYRSFPRTNGQIIKKTVAGLLTYFVLFQKKPSRKTFSGRSYLYETQKITAAGLLQNFTAFPFNYHQAEHLI